jgi:hypothetical protein
MAAERNLKLHPNALLQIDRKLTEKLLSDTPKPSLKSEGS